MVPFRSPIKEGRQGTGAQDDIIVSVLAGYVSSWALDVRARTRLLALKGKSIRAEGALRAFKIGSGRRLGAYRGSNASQTDHGPAGHL